MEKRLSGGYIQFWDDDRMNVDATWKGVVSEMKSLGRDTTHGIEHGMDTIIIQYMSYLAKLPKSMSIASMILDHAKENGMKVFLGLYQNPAVEAGSLISISGGELERSKRESLKVAGDLKTAFEHYEDTFCGWHIPLESWMSNYDPATTADLHKYYKELTAGLKSILPKKVLISPFINGENPGDNTNFKRTDPDKAGTKYTEILRDTGIDFLALQDGVGHDYISVSHPDLPEYFAEMCDACKENNVELWANVESFDWIKEAKQGTATDIGRFTLQLEVAQRASRIVTFDFFHYMNIKNILDGTARPTSPPTSPPTPTSYKDRVEALNQGYREWLAERKGKTSIESEPCVSLS